MDEKDQPQPEVIIKKLVDKHGFNKAEITEIVEKCVKEKGIDGCETAYKIFICYRSNRVVRDRFKKPNNPSGTTSGVQPVTPNAVRGAPSVTPASRSPGSPTGASLVTPASHANGVPLVISSAGTSTPKSVISNSPIFDPKINNNPNSAPTSTLPLPPPLPLNPLKASH